MDEKIRVLVVDDHGVVRSGIRTLLSLHEDMDVVGEASNGREALSAFSRLEPDVLLMDLKMPVMDGPTAIEHIRQTDPGVGILALTSLEDESVIRSALEAGATGLLFKDADEEELVGAIRMVSRGKAVVAPDAMRVVMDPDPSGLTVSLTTRELEILRLIAQGRTNRAIAGRLEISVSTVNFHVHNILDKLDAKTRTEAVATAVRDGLIEL